MKIATKCVHFEACGDPFDAISPPIYQTATFRQPTASEFREYDYTRTANPTRTLVEDNSLPLKAVFTPVRSPVVWRQSRR